MVCENAGRWARIHDIYIFVILKPFLGNRIGDEIILPVPRAVFPARLPFRRPPYRPAVPMGREDRVHDQAADRVLDRSADRCVPFVPSPVPFLSPFPPSRSSHPSISSARRASARLVSLSRHLAVRLSLVPFLSPPYRQAGRGGVPSPTVSPFPDRCLVSSDVVGCGDIPMDVA